jgi:four helix bundle protein
MSRKIVRHQDLEVYRKAFEAAMQIFEISKQFPKEETYSLTDQVRRASRSVCSNIAEAWRKRRYEAAFISKLNDAEGEAAETQTWLEFAVRCEYLKPEVGRALFRTYDEIISMLVSMINNPQTWVLPSGQRRTVPTALTAADKSAANKNNR